MGKVDAAAASQATARLYGQKFFAAFFQKRSACFLLLSSPLAKTQATLIIGEAY
jgi:hypothetical protein